MTSISIAIASDHLFLHLCVLLLPIVLIFLHPWAQFLFLFIPFIRKFLSFLLQVRWLTDLCGLFLCQFHRLSRISTLPSAPFVPWPSEPFTWRTLFLSFLLVVKFACQAFPLCALHQYRLHLHYSEILSYLRLLALRISPFIRIDLDFAPLGIPILSTSLPLLRFGSTIRSQY